MDSYTSQNHFPPRREIPLKKRKKEPDRVPEVPPSEPSQLPALPTSIRLPSQSKCPKQRDKKHEYTVLKELLKKLTTVEEFQPFWKHPALRKNSNENESILLSDYDENFLNKHMCLSIIQTKLEQEKYEDPWDFIVDVNRITKNAKAKASHYKATKINNLSLQFCSFFQATMNQSMPLLGYCCGEVQMIEPQKLDCLAKENCLINVCTTYFSYQDKYRYCNNCFKSLPDETVLLPKSNPSDDTVAIPKCEFVRMTNNKEEMEPFVRCNKCNRRCHQMCVLYYKEAMPKGYYCGSCYWKNNNLRQDRLYTAQSLPPSEVSNFIEGKVNRFIRDNGEMNSPITVRMLANFEREVQVKAGMKRLYVEAKKLRDRFPYRSKIIFVFQTMEGVDTCVFAFIVQEYGSDCPPPNSRLVYLAYLDSVQFFRPKRLRTAVFHEIILSYFEHAKKLGFEMAHIWSCPPTDGDDYIFHRHPPEQKVPTPKMLCQWYRTLLGKGVEQGILVGFKSFKEHVESEHITSVHELPYFEGDFWPNQFEEIINQLEKQREQEQRHSTSPATPRKSKKGLRGGNPTSVLSECGQDSFIWEKVRSEMAKQKEVFFAVRLCPYESTSFRIINDPDIPDSRPCSLLQTQTRDGLLSLARDNRFEFTSLRRAKYLTMVILFHLYRSRETNEYFCSNCGENITFYVRYHCQNSGCSRDHCRVCYAKTRRCLTCTSRCDIIGFKEPILQFFESSEPDRPDAKKSDSMLLHSSKCKNNNCSTRCILLKKRLDHINHCNLEHCNLEHGHCNICTEMMGHIFQHASSCSDKFCTVYFCMNTKQTIIDQRSTISLKIDEVVATLDIKGRHLHDVSNQNARKGLNARRRLQF